MEAKDPQTVSFEPKPPQDRGAGGKLRKPPSRRPPSTPYARPPQNQLHRGHWLSKLVDPARRLISGGANLILPSFFSKSQSINALPAPTGQEENHGYMGTDNLHMEVEDNADGHDGNFTQNHVESRVIGEAGSSRVAGRSNSNLDLNGQEQNQKVEVSDPDGLSDIERLIKDKNFSRDEINRLMEIINSKVVDLPDVAQENKHSITTADDLRGSTAALEYSGKLSGARQEDLNRANWETSRIRERKYSSAISLDARKPIALENSREPTEEKREDLGRIILKSSTPILQSKLQDDVGASPIEIARAYMEHRTPEVVFNLTSRDEAALSCGDELALKPFIPTPVPKPSPRWPGAIVQDQLNYITPQSERGRFGLQNFPRTPYSRTIHSRTKSRLIQLQGNSDRHPSVIATPFQQTKTPSGQVYSRSNVLNGGHGSVGPIRRVQHKVTAETPRVSGHFQTSLNGAQVEKFSVSEGLFSAPKTNMENGQIGSSKFQSFSSKLQNTEVSIPTVPSHSSQVARKILEHLERNPPTPKDKSAELRLATSWKKPQPSDLTFMPNKLNRLTLFGGLDSSEKSTQVHKDNPQESTDGVNAVVSNNTSTSDTKDATPLTHGHNAGPSLDFRKAQDAQLKNSEEVVPNSTDSEVSNLQKKLQRQSSGAKPVLPSIAIDKPKPRWTFSSDNSLGFTFPVSTGSGGSSEPPTPSIMPTSSIIVPAQQNEGSSIPSYTFGSRRSSPALVFSFPSTSSAFVLEDASDIKFNFGSDESARISFGSVGQGAICY